MALAGFNSKKIRKTLLCKRNLDKKLTFGEFFILTRLLLRFIGLSNYEFSFTGNEEYKNSWNLKRFGFLGVLAIIYILCFVENIVTEFRKDFYAALELLLILMTGSMLIMQAIRFYVAREEAGVFVQDGRDLFAEFELIVPKDVKKEAVNYILLNNIYTSIVLLCALLYILRPFSSAILYDTASANEITSKVFPLTYPFAIDTRLKIILCYIGEAWVVIICGIAWAASDMAFFQITCMTSLGIQVIAKKLRCLPDELFNDDSTPVNRLEKIIERHNKLMQYTSRLEKLFNPIILMIMVYTGLAMCICIICAEKELLRNEFFSAVKFTIYFLCLLLQSTGYCSACDNLNYTVENLSNAMYECQWLRCSMKFKKMMIPVMRIAQRGYKFRAYGFYYVNKTTVTKILLATINFVTVLRNSPSLRS